MGRFIILFIRKIFVAFVTIFVVATATFFLMRTIPGNIYSGERAMSETVIQNIKAKYHLDEPLIKQYIFVMNNILRLDFGVSMIYEGRSVNEIISTHFTLSATIGSISLVVSLVSGIILGIISAVIKNNKKIFLVMLLISLSMAVPNFVAAILLQYFFAVKLNIFPVLGGKNIIGFILPILALSLYSTAFIARFMYYNLKDILQKDYIVAARARGIAESRIIYIHALKNALLSLSSYAGPLFAGLLVGNFAIETIFSIPGLGRYYILSIADRDYTTIMGITIFYAILLVFINLIVDVLNRFIDPRIKSSANN